MAATIWTRRSMTSVTTMAYADLNIACSSQGSILGFQTARFPRSPFQTEKPAKCHIGVIPPTAVLVGQKRLLPLQDDIASTARWYRSEPHAAFPTLPGLNELEVT